MSCGFETPAFLAIEMCILDFGFWVFLDIWSLGFGFEVRCPRFFYLISDFAIVVDSKGNDGLLCCPFS